jgi:opacity protein-like surface antigen
MKRLAAIVALTFAFTSTAAFAENNPRSSGWSGFNVGLDSGYAWDPTICTSALPAGVLTQDQASARSATGCVHPNVGGVIGGGEFWL